MKIFTAALSSTDIIKRESEKGSLFLNFNAVFQKYFLTEFVPLNLMQSYYGALKSKITVNADDEILQLSHFSFIGKNGNTLI